MSKMSKNVKHVKHVKNVKNVKKLKNVNLYRGKEANRCNYSKCADPNSSFHSIRDQQKVMRIDEAYHY